uniref:protein-glutamine gamma-glutamyltransferase 5-like isoform X2 n=1 Tax=Semicossyphus pulcher TaxID=241346 RepID=UPI0037E761C7
MQQTQYTTCGSLDDLCRLKLVNYEIHDNNIAHETEGLSNAHLVVRRGKPFKVTLMFDGRSWNPMSEILILEVLLGDMSEKFMVHCSDQLCDPQKWSAKVHRNDMHSESATIHICSPVLASVALHDLILHIETNQVRRSYLMGTFVLICNPWLKEDPVYMPFDDQIQEYIKSDYGLLYMGTPLNISRRPWSFGQYEPGVLEACLKLLQVSPNHQFDKNKDYSLRANPVYLSRVICALVNSNDDLGILTGKWQGSYADGVKPTEWSGSADIINQWASSNCKAVRYGQCWVFASVLCTVMRVLGIPSRVVTVFNAAHDTDGTLKIEEYYSSKGEKLHISKDSIWNFHVWVECWMRRPDIGSGFDGWQVLDPTPQEKSGGTYRCGPCPVVAIKEGRLEAAYDTSFVYASVDADIVRMIVSGKAVMQRKEDTKTVGKLIYTKSINSDTPEDLTPKYKDERRSAMQMCRSSGSPYLQSYNTSRGGSAMLMCSSEALSIPMCRSSEPPESLEVSIEIEGTPTVGESIKLCVTVTDYSNRTRVLEEYLSAQLKEFNSSPQESFWKEHKSVHIKAGEVLKLYHTIDPSDYEAFLAGDDIVNVAVVMNDTGTEERFLAAEEFNISSPKITIEVEGGDSIHVRKTYTATVFFINTFAKTLNGAVLTVEGSGLIKGKQEARMGSLQHGDKIQKQVSIEASSPGTKVLMATFSHSKCPNVVSRCFHKVSVKSD